MSNGFTDEQKALIREIAWEVGDALGKQLDEKISNHLETCPIGRKVSRFAWFVAGALIAGGVAGLGLGGVARLILAM